MATLAVAAFAGLGFAFRAIAPLLRRARGVWAWSAAVYVLGTIGAFGADMVNFTLHRWEAGDWLCPAGGACYALAVASFLPGVRVRLGALGAATVLAAGGSYAAWAAAQPPTLDEWITANGVDRALLKVGGPPPGYTLKAVGASEVGFRVEYARPHSVRLRLDVERTEHDNPRTDASGCPVSSGVPIRCKDDGAGRRLVTYENGYEHQELCLRRDGLVYTVTMEGFHGDLSAARHILTTLRPATDTELGDLVEQPTQFAATHRPVVPQSVRPVASQSVRPGRTGAASPGRTGPTCWPAHVRRVEPDESGSQSPGRCVLI